MLKEVKCLGLVKLGWSDFLVFHNIKFGEVTLLLKSHNVPKGLGVQVLSLLVQTRVKLW